MPIAEASASPLIGREAELDVLSGLVGRLAAGQGSSRSIVAPAGAGKTALLDVVAARATSSGARLLRVSGYEAEADLPWAALSSLFLAHRDRFERLPGPQGRALQAAFALVDTDAPIDRLAVSLGVLGVLSDLAMSTPLVVLVDDVHWLDPESRSALGFLARRLSDDPVVLITAGRPDGGPPPAEPMTLGKLSNVALVELLKRDGVRSIGAQSAIIQLVDGNPLLARQLVESLTPGERSGARPAPTTLRVPADVEDLFRPRIERLGEATIDALLLLAADISVDGERAGATLARFQMSAADLEPAEAAGLVAIDGNRVRFAHPLARSAVYHHVTPQQRRRAHQLLADIEGPTTPRGVLHRASAAVGADQDLADDLAFLARDAQGRGAPLVAAAHWSQAAAVASDIVRRAQLLVDGARAALAAGGTRWAAELLDEAEAADPERADGLDARRVRVRLAAAAGRHDEARRLADATALAFGTSDPVGVAEVLSEAVRPLLPVAPHLAAPLCEQIWELAGDAGPPSSLYAEVLHGCGRFLRGDHAAAAHLARWRDLLDAEGPVVAGQFLAETIVLYFVRSNQLAQAAAVLDEIEGPLRSRCASSALVSVLTARGFLQYGLDLRASVAASREAIEVADAAGLAGLTPLALQVVVVAAGTVGDEATTVLVADRLLASDDATDRAFARAGLARLHLVAGRFDQAADQFDQIRADIGPRNPTTCSFEGDEVEALVRVSRVDDARAVLPALEAAAQFGPWARGQHRRSLALVSDDLDEAVVHFAAARDAFSETDNRISQGITELLWGERLRRAKRRAEARRHLERAVERFGRVGATGLRRRAEDELATAGGASDPSRPTTELLGPVELQVARLAVGGATNRDIANQLFISPRTVENHLGAVYRKLGVSGRPLLLARATEDPMLRPPAPPVLS